MATGVEGSGSVQCDVGEWKAGANPGWQIWGWIHRFLLVFLDRPP
jgi:hypothetical protein